MARASIPLQKVRQGRFLPVLLRNAAMAPTASAVIVPAPALAMAG